MNIENVKKWTNTLRTTEREQISHTLIGIDSETGEITGMCCLGIGEVECMGKTITTESIAGTYFPRVNGEARSNGLPGSGFARWLGASVLGSEDAAKSDVTIDTPGIFTVRAGEDLDDEEYSHVTASILNDEFHLTFAQIADMVDYFGVR